MNKVTIVGAGRVGWGRPPPRCLRSNSLPCVSILDGEYGQRDIAMGVPCVIANAGLESVVELDLNETEQELFTQSVACVREDLARMQV